MSTGRNARRATGIIVAESEESVTRTESVPRWSREGRAAHEAEGEAPLFDPGFVFFYRCEMFQSGRKFIALEETGISFPS